VEILLRNELLAGRQTHWLTTYLPTYLPTSLPPWKKSKKLIVTQVVKRFSAFYGTWRFITVRLPLDP